MTQTNDSLSVRDIVKHLPRLPGVYQFYDREGNVIYIGKAKNLKNRVNQYFLSEESLTKKTRVMVSKVCGIRHTVTESEGDALLLENNLIKEYQPKYNVMLKDSKTYPWICVKKEPFPRVFITRKLKKDGSLYFGPYASSSNAHNLVELISSLYYLRDCRLVLSHENIIQKKFKPCLKYHLNKCKAPCVGLFSEKEYNRQIDMITSLLKGDTSSLIKEFRKKMESESQLLNFEEANRYKEKIALITNHKNKSVIVNQNISDIDVFSLAFDNNSAYGNYMRVMNGSIIQSLNLEFKMPIEESKEHILTLFITEVFLNFGSESKEILVSFLPDSQSIAEKCHIPKRGDKLYLLKLSEKNSFLFKTERLKQEESLRPDDYQGRVMESIRKDLGMSNLPVHIECFDNSNIQGKFAVAACVVFKNGIPSKKEYRHFNIKTVTGANDFESMKEVVYRRYSRLIAEGEPLPQLIVIDGGKGQLSFAISALRELGIESKIKIIGIAKRLEELIIPGDPNPLFLDKNSVTLRILMHLRDEAHRFGIAHHRNIRSKHQIASQLRQIKGVGEKSEQKLLSKYGSVTAIKKASEEELTKLIGSRAAGSLLSYFAKESSS